MRLAIRRWKVYFRVVLVAAVALGVALVLFNNRHYSVQVWFFGLTDETKPINVIWLMICTAGAAVISWWTTSIALRLIRDWREVREAETLQKLKDDQAKRDQEMKDRERRIDEKIQRALSQEGKPSHERQIGDPE